MRLYNVDEAKANQLLDEDNKLTEVWANDIYQVETRKLPHNLLHINIRRRDGGVIFRDWRHFQRIKNQLAGEECEAIEIYPAESRLVDTTNKYHLYACLDPTFRFPVGFKKRDVSYDTAGAAAGLRQRKL